jgi:hypothetical protein
MHAALVVVAAWFVLNAAFLTVALAKAARRERLIKAQARLMVLSAEQYLSRSHPAADRVSLGGR